MRKMLQQKPPSNTRKGEAGNLLFYVLIGIILMGMLAVALRRDDGLSNGIDNEAASVKANQIVNYGVEVAQGVKTVLDSGVSEADIRFAYPDAHTDYGDITVNPAYQIFSAQGGNAKWRQPPANVSTGQYEISAEMAIYGTGTDKADLTLTLYPLTLPMCNAINQRIGITTIPVVSNCPSSPRFAGTYRASPIVPLYSVTPSTPQPQACISCTNAGVYLFYYTILAR